MTNPRSQPSEPNQLSKCHQAPVRLVGGRGDFSDKDIAVTMHYECLECGDVCDLYVPVDKRAKILSDKPIPGSAGNGSSDRELEELVRDLTQVHLLSKSKVREMVTTYCDRKCREARINELQKAISDRRSRSSIKIKRLDYLEDRLAALQEKDQ